MVTYWLTIINSLPDELLGQAIQIAYKTEGYWQVQALAMCIPRLASDRRADLIRDTWNAARARYSRSEIAFAEALGYFVKYLPQEQWQEVFNEVCELTDPTARTTGFAVLFPHLFESPLPQFYQFWSTALRECSRQGRREVLALIEQSAPFLSTFGDPSIYPQLRKLINETVIRWP